MIEAIKNFWHACRGGHCCKDCGTKTADVNPLIIGSVNDIPIMFHNIHYENLCSACTFKRISISIDQGENVTKQACLYFPEERTTVYRVGSIKNIAVPGKVCVLLGSTRWNTVHVSKRAIAALLKQS
jgi:hypothetical protein